MYWTVLEKWAGGKEGPGIPLVLHAILNVLIETFRLAQSAPLDPMFNWPVQKHLKLSVVNLQCRWYERSRIDRWQSENMCEHFLYQ
jgi:hypothetical protein